MGFTADIIIWDLETRQLMHRMALHKVSGGHACAAGHAVRTAVTPCHSVMQLA